MAGVKFLILGLGILDILTGLFLMPFLLLYGVITFIAGLLYFIFGVAVIFKKLYVKLLFYGIIPFTILHSVEVMLLSRSQDASNYFRMSLENQMGWVLPFLFICFSNVYFFTCHNIKEQFK